MARSAASLAGLAVFLAMGILYSRDATVGLYLDILYGWGMDGFAFPFLDFAGYLSSLECSRLGVDVIAANPCDPLDRAFNYGPLWLDLTFLPLYPANRVVGGVALGLLFLGALSLLPPPRGGWQLGITVLASVSATVVFAIERGNPDIFIFLLVLGVVFLLQRNGAGRALAYALIWFGTGLKFYPVVLLALAVRERGSRFWWIFVLSLLFGAGYSANYFDPLTRILTQLPSGNYDSDLFAAKNLPMRLGRFTELALAPSSSAVMAGFLVVGGLAVLLLGRAARQVQRLLANPGFAVVLGRMAPRTYLLLLSGCLLTVGCFFAGQNIAYRGIFLLLILPGLFVFAQSALPAQAELGRRGLWATLFLLWESAFRVGLARVVAAVGLDDGPAFMLRLVFWIFRELVWWWMAGAMLAVVVQFLWASPPRRAVMMRAGAR